MSCMGLGGVKRATVLTSDRLCAATEVALLFVFVLLLVWSVPATPQPLRFYSGVAILTWVFGLTIMSHLAYGETLNDLGLGGKGLGRALSELYIPVGIIALILLAVGLSLGTLHINHKFFFNMLGVPFWALFQQYAAQSFINRRLQIVFGPGKKSAALTAFIFAAIHLPNPALTVATAVAGYIWARVFQRSSNLYAIALSHGLLSALFGTVMPKSILPNMVVGYNYLIK